MAVSSDRIRISAIAGVVVMVGDMILHPSAVKPFWSESAIIGLVGYMITFITLSVRSFLR